MSHRRNRLGLSALSWLVLGVVATGCGTGSTDDSTSGLCSDGVNGRPAAWTVSSHCPGVAANYTEVFDGLDSENLSPTVRRFDISMSASDYANMEADLASIVSAASGNLDALPTPMWVPTTVTYNNNVWTEVGMRWKGHASLTGAVANGIEKLSFALDFDNQEDNYPELENQHFWGFKRLNFANGYKDPAIMRDKVAGEIFRDAGVPAPYTSFARVYLDVGNGPVYYGVYTIIEDPADEMLTQQIGSKTGNLYKPWGYPAKWITVAEAQAQDATITEETYYSTYFEKSTNEDVLDWTDAKALYAALHATTRETDPVAWRAGLEAVFNLDAFLRTLATNQIMMNWDSYGCMPHNYMLYANPMDSDRFMWLPWDLNEAMSIVVSSNCIAPGAVLYNQIVTPPTTETLVDTNWPMIANILGDETYMARYLTIVREVLDGAFEATQLKAKMQQYHDLISEYVIGPTETEVAPYTNTSKAKFEASLTGVDSTGATITEVSTPLQSHVDSRHTAVEKVLASASGTGGTTSTTTTTTTSTGGATSTTTTTGTGGVGGVGGTTST